MAATPVDAVADGAGGAAASSPPGGAYPKALARIRSMHRWLSGAAPVARDMPLRTGVDLGTANVAVAVLDGSGEPVACALQAAQVVRDGVVLDYLGAVKVLRRLLQDLEGRIGRRLTHAAAAVPPGTGFGVERITANVLVAAGLEVTQVVEEPTAAAALLGVTDGAVVDVGGGTTGISILRDGQVIYTADEPTGGTHFTLVLAGHYRISVQEAEAMKVGGATASEIFPVVLPVVEKVASIVSRHLAPFGVEQVYLVGGAAALAGMDTVISACVGLPVMTPDHPLLVTPMGIALLSDPQEV